MIRSLFLLLAALLAATSAPAAAQSAVTNTSGVAFLASPDHNTTVGSAAIVTSYELDVMAQNSTGAFAFTYNLGKPTPDASNVITVKPISQFGTLAAGTYTMTIQTIGPGGSAVSPASDPFARVAAPGPAGKPVVK